MSIPGRKRALSVAALGCVIGLAAVAGPVLGAKQFQQIKGRAVAVGTFTPGQLEQVAVKRMPKRGKLRVIIGPAGAPGACSGPYVCLPVLAQRAAGTPRWHTSGKGRALLTFVMPTYYERFRVDNLKAPNERVEWADGMPILVEVDGIASHRDKQTFGIAVARTTIEIQ